MAKPGKKPQPSYTTILALHRSAVKQTASRTIYRYAKPSRQSACHTYDFGRGIKCTWPVIWLCLAHFHFQLSSSTPSPPSSSARHHHLYLHLHLTARQRLLALSPAQRISFKLKKNETIFLFLAKSAAPTSLQRLLYSISYSKPMLL